MRIDIYVHGSKESVRRAGECAGLTGEALDVFAYAGSEFKVTLEVDQETGIAAAVALDGLDLLRM